MRQQCFILSFVVILAVLVMFLMIWLWNPQSLHYKTGPYGVILWASRTTLAVGGTCFWVGPTLFAVALGLEPFIFKMYWNDLPWFRSKK